jgi:hypothetical protein
MKTQATIKFRLHLGADEMDRTSLSIAGVPVVWDYPESIMPGDSFSLSVPSGGFIGTVTGAGQASESDENRGVFSGQWLVTVAGEWAGKRGGLLGGMSGRGLWTVIQTGRTCGTFGTADSLDEYDARAAAYRARFVTNERDERGFWLPPVLTSEGEKLAAEFLRERGNPSVGSAADQAVIESLDHDWAAYTATLSSDERLTLAAYDSAAGWREFNMWLDRKFPVLRYCTPAAEARGRAEVGAR